MTLLYVEHNTAHTVGDKGILGSSLLTFGSLAAISCTTRFNIQKFYMVLALRLGVLYGHVPCTALKDRFCIAEVEGVYSAVRTESLYKTDKLRL